MGGRRHETGCSEPNDLLTTHAGRESWPGPSLVGGLLRSVILEKQNEVARHLHRQTSVNVGRLLHQYQCYAMLSMGCTPRKHFGYVTVLSWLLGGAILVETKEDLFHLERIARAVLVLPDVDLELLHHAHHLV